MKEVTRYSQEELLFEIALLWFDNQFKPSFGRLFRKVVREQPAEFFAQWLSKEVEKVSKEHRDQTIEELNCARRQGFHILHYLSPDYPACLREIVDPPLVIFVWSQVFPDLSMGITPKCWRMGQVIGVVGSRSCSHYGMQNSRRLGSEVVAAGGVVVSGLALGVDQAAHEGALEAAHRLRLCDQSPTCPTVAVIGSGLECIYPKSNEWLAQAIVDAGGAVISEFGLRAPPRKHHFPQRNRLISALSDVVIVVEAKNRSGALITARLALEQGKEVLAIPGQIDAPSSQGTNELIKQGAAPYTGIADLLTPEALRGNRVPRLTSVPALQAPGQSQAHKKSADSAPINCSLRPLGDDEIIIFKLLRSDGPLTPQQLSDLSAISSANMSAILSVLELDGFIEREGFGYRIGI